MKEEEVDFSSSTIETQRFHTTSYAKIYEMSAKRRWQWLRNLVHLKKWTWEEKSVGDFSDLVALFSSKEDLLADTDLSFAQNPIPFSSRGAEYIDENAFKEYLGYLAHHRHYHLLSQFLFNMLKQNSVNTIDLLRNLIQARNQLIESQFCNENFTLLYVKNKSQQWIASLMCRILPKIPEEIRNVVWHDPGYIGHGKRVLLCDDIAYTGTQVSKMLSSLGMKNKDIKITLVFGKMSIYALSVVKEEIKKIKEVNPGFEVNIVVGELFHTLSVQLDCLPFPPTKNERHIIKQILESDFSEQYRLGDFRRKPLLTTAWKKPDFVSSYYKFLGLEKEGPNPIGISSALLSKLPSEPITLFSSQNPAPNVEVTSAFIAGPQKPPYKQAHGE